MGSDSETCVNIIAKEKKDILYWQIMDVQLVKMFINAEVKYDNISTLELLVEQQEEIISILWNG